MILISHKLEELAGLKYNTLVTVECDHCHRQFQKERKLVLSSIQRGRKNFFCNPKCLGAFRYTYHNTRPPKPKKLLKLTCMECHCEFERKQQQNKNTFCSHQCAYQYRVKHIPDKIIPNKTIRLITSPALFKLNCPYCHQDFEKKRINQKSKNGTFCSKKCFYEFRKTTTIHPIKCLCNCVQCNKQVLRSKSDLKKSKNKNGLVFCSRSCRMRHQNLNNPKKYGCRRSKAETFLCKLITDTYPKLVISENDRTVLPSKLEIDIYIPQMKLAIELNGPVHYLPIYGEEKLKNCQHRDILKQQEIAQLGLSMLVLDISRLCSKKKTEAFLVEYFQSHIKPILDCCQY